MKNNDTPELPGTRSLSAAEEIAVWREMVRGQETKRPRVFDPDLAARVARYFGTSVKRVRSAYQKGEMFQWK